MWHKSENHVRPLQTDMSSSANYNIVTKNVEEVTYIDDDGNEQIKYVYEEAYVRKDNWDQYLQLEQQNADIAFIAMMTEAEL